MFVLIDLQTLAIALKLIALKVSVLILCVQDVMEMKFVVHQCDDSLNKSLLFNISIFFYIDFIFHFI